MKTQPRSERIMACLVALMTATLLSRGSLAAASPNEVCPAATQKCSANATVAEYISCLERLNTMMEQCKKRIAALRSAMEQRVIAALDNKAAEAKGALDAEAVAVHDHLTQVDRINKDHERVIHEISERVSGFVREFQDQVRQRLEASIAALSEDDRKLSTLVQEKSYAALDELVVERQRVRERGISDLNDAASISSKASLLDETLKILSRRYGEQMEGHRDFLAQRGLQDIMLDTSALQNVMMDVGQAASDHRTSLSDALKRFETKFDAVTETILDKRAGAVVAPTLAKHAHLKSSAEFLAQVNRKVREWITDPAIEGNRASRMPVFAGRLAGAQNFVDYHRSVCGAESPPSWMHSGCNIVRRQSEGARRFIDSTPSLLESNLQLLQGHLNSSYGAEIAAIADLLKGGKIPQTATAYDQLVREALP